MDIDSAKAIMALIVLATVIDGMDASVVNVVLPDMAAELGITVSSSAFVSVAYLIPIAGSAWLLARSPTAVTFAGCSRPVRPSSWRPRSAAHSRPAMSR